MERTALFQLDPVQIKQFRRNQLAAISWLAIISSARTSAE
jgi:hypothetical protein